MNKTMVATIILVSIATAILFSAIAFYGGYGLPAVDTKDINQSLKLDTTPLTINVPIQTNKSDGIYYGYVGYRQKLTSGRDNDIIVLAKFSDYASCNLWIEGRKKDNTVVESTCENSQKPDTSYYEKAIQLKTGDRTYLSFIDTTGISVRVMPLSGSSEDSTLVVLILKKQLESSGITNIQVIYRLN